MAAHPQSVLDPIIGQWDQAMYDKLCELETYVYDQSSLGLSHYQPFVQQLNDAIIAWMGIDRTDLVSEAIQAQYTSHIMWVMYGSGQQITDANTIVTIDGYRTDVLSYPSNAWDDGTVGVPPNPGTAPTLEADTAKVNGAWANQEQAAWEALANGSGSSVQGIIMELLFEDKQPNATAPTKQQMGQIVYVDNHYKDVVVYLSANIPLPSYV